MLVINDRTKTLLINKNMRFKLRRGIRIEFEFTNPLYNEIFDIQQSYLIDNFIYVIGRFNKTYKNLFPHVGDKIDYNYTKVNVEEDLYE